MSSFHRLGVFCIALLSALPAYALPSKTLPAFRSEKQLADFLAHRRQLERASAAATKLPSYSMAMPAPVMGGAPMAAPPPPAPSAPVQSVTVSSSRVAADGITNNQETGVDEGDIVKKRGDILVVLRRGRLFTLSTAGGDLHAIDHIDAYPPGIDAGGDWYDEMLVSGDRVIVIGYSYRRAGTQINRFHLGPDGLLSFEDAYQLRSNDYYSSRNYASRLIGHHLLVYSPRRLSDGMAALPGMRRWDGRGPEPGFRRVGTARQVYLSPGVAEEEVDTVHTIMDCDLSLPEVPCKATSLLGPGGRVFYVSAHAVYVWTTSYRPGPSAATLYRLPLDGSAPSAVRAWGAPSDQFSFQEDEARHRLNVMVTADGKGDAMWSAERTPGEPALLQLPLGAFDDGTAAPDRRQYRPLPMLHGDRYFALQNRFVGDTLLYGAGNGWGRPRQRGDEIVVASTVEKKSTVLGLSHGIDRIEVLGRDALVVGADENDLHFSTVLLTGGPALGDQYVLRDAAQGETRSHGFFFQPRDEAGDGLLGLPVARRARAAYRQLFDSSAAVLFIRREGGRFAPLGELEADQARARPDSCAASCVDWYGNARPIFAGTRIFALMGYELVEGRSDGREIREVNRLDFAPAPMSIPVR